MGLIGIIISIAIVGLGAGYYFFGMRASSIEVNNSLPVPIVEQLNTYTELKNEATEIKNTAEEKAKEAMAVLENIPTTPKEEPKKEESQTEPKTDTELRITNRLMDSGFSVPAKQRTIDTIVLHSSYNPNGGDAYSVSEIVKIYESYGVSAHYLIDRSGKIYRLVEDKNIAYHAGTSKMPDGRKNVNDFSVGIEIMNKEDTEYTKAQYDAVNNLVAYLKKKYTIKSVVGHGDIAPDRKTDPWNFDWKKLK